MPPTTASASAAPSAWTPSAPGRAAWLIPAALLALATIAVWAFDLDRRVATLYFDPAGPPFWPVGYRQPWDFVYTWAVMPAMGVAVAGLALLTLGYTCRLPWQRWAGALILLSLLLGPFLLTNGVFHELWGRPRPRQVTEFGGDRPFRQVLLPTFHRDEQAFPTGHAAGGFSLLILALALWPRSRRWAWAVALAALVSGGMTSWARITQGGHFFSDGIWSAAVIWFAALAVQWGLARWGARSLSPARPARLKRIAAWTGAGVAAVTLVVGYMAYLPIQERTDWRVDVPPGTKQVQAIVATGGVIRLQQAPGTSQVRIFATLSGRGWPWAELWERRAGPALVEGELRLYYIAFGKGMRRGGNVSVVVVAPPGLPVTVEQQGLGNLLPQRERPPIPKAETN